MLHTYKVLSCLLGCIQQLLPIQILSDAAPGTERQSYFSFAFLCHFCIAFKAEAVASFTDEETSMGRLQHAVGIIPEG